ncbi:MAG: hypothetical protein AAF961_00340, partial [Planctomycetota bacterium]
MSLWKWFTRLSCRWTWLLLLWAVSCTTSASDGGAGRLLFVCERDNDLYQAASATYGTRVSRYDQSTKAVASA